MPKRLATVNDFTAPSTSSTAIGLLSRSGIRRRSGATARTSRKSVRLSSLNLKSEPNGNSLVSDDKIVWSRLSQAENLNHQVHSRKLYGDLRDEGYSETSFKPLPALPSSTRSPNLSSMLDDGLESCANFVHEQEVQDELRLDSVALTSPGNTATSLGAGNPSSLHRSHSHSSTVSTSSMSTISSLPTPDYWGHVRGTPDYFHIPHIQGKDFASHIPAQFLKTQSRAESFNTATSATLIPSRRMSPSSKYLGMRSQSSSSTDCTSSQPSQPVRKSVKTDRSRTQKDNYLFMHLSGRKPGPMSQELDNFNLILGNDVNHHILPPAIYRKLTRKWPVPRLDFAVDKSMAKLESARASGASEQWTPHKWCLMLSVATAFVYGTVGMGFVIATWSNAWLHADVTLVTSPDILTLATLLSILLLLAACLGGAGTLLRSRQLLALYTLLLIPSLFALLSIAYIAYKRANFAPASKISFAWSRHYTQAGRLVIQNSLGCCGLDNPEHDGVLSQQCYPRSMLEGCKVALWSHEVAVLSEVYTTFFAVLLPVHLLHLVTALLCANHVDKQFGKGIMPKQYWLSAADVSEAWSEVRKHGNQNVVRGDIDAGGRYKREASQADLMIARPRRVWEAPSRTHSWIEKHDK